MILEEENMTRIELYHKHKPRQVQLRGPFLILLLFILIFASGYLLFQKYDQRPIRISSPDESPGKKVIVSLPNGQEVFTYEKYIVKKGSKIYYKGERNTIDLTGGKVEYKNW
jgi:hypothetical protein